MSETLTVDQARKLNRIKGRHTKYEVVLEHRDGRRLLLCYAPQTRVSVRAYLRAHPELAERIVDGWAWDFSGRTQREAILGGELAWFGKVLVVLEGN